MTEDKHSCMLADSSSAARLACHSVMGVMRLQPDQDEPPPCIKQASLYASSSWSAGIAVTNSEGTLMTKTSTAWTFIKLALQS